MSRVLQGIRLFAGLPASPAPAAVRAMDASFLSERLDTASRTFATLERQLADPDVAADPARLEPLARERARSTAMLTALRA